VLHWPRCRLPTLQLPGTRLANLKKIFDISIFYIEISSQFGPAAGSKTSPNRLHGLIKSSTKPPKTGKSLDLLNNLP
jgi:hypothetical protein